MMREALQRLKDEAPEVPAVARAPARHRRPPLLPVMIGAARNLAPIRIA
jgi:hypothetical protein